jgi:putative membrane protein
MIAFALGAGTIALYLYGVALYRRRYPYRPFSPLRVASFVAGAALMTAVLLPPADALADRSFTAHMAEHMVLLLVAPPLMLLGAPLLLLVAVTPQRVARRITAFAQSPFGHALFSPITGFLAYVGVLWGIHFTEFYEWALTYPAVHVVEHLLFIITGFLFWSTVVQVGYAPRAVPYPARMLYLFLAIPQGAFLGFALGATRTILYPHYLTAWGNLPSALLDQHNGADVMWIGGGFLLFCAFMLTASAWAVAERRSEVVT